jgi:hypothetical protein
MTRERLVVIGALPRWRSRLEDLRPDPAIQPAPEIVGGRRAPGTRWAIEHCVQAHTGIADGRYAAPLVRDGAARALRLHELLHIAHSPRDAVEVARRERLPLDFLYAVEDARLGILAARDPGIQDVMDGLRFVDIPRPISLSEPRDAVCVLLATRATGVGAQYRRALEQQYRRAERARKRPRPDVVRACEFIREICANAESILRSNPTDFEVTVRACRYLERVFKAEERRRRPPSDGTAPVPTVLPEPARTHPAGDAAPPPDQLPHPGTQIAASDGRWGTMRIETPPLSILFPPARLRAPEPRPATYGTAPIYMHRWACDQKIFAAGAVSQGGTVLIDCSGSMNLKPHQIERAICAGADLTAMYGGTRGPDGRGALRIVSRRGRRAEAVHLRGWGWNVVDGPALRWLAAQPPPRVWVSDGYVHGIDGLITDGMVEEVEQLCARWNIRRVETVGEAAAALRALRAAAATVRRPAAHGSGQA